MKRVNYGNVDLATDRLEKIKADSLFPGLLSDRQLEEIQQRRIKKEKLRRKKTGIKTKVTDVTPDEYVVRGGGLDDNGYSIDDFDIVRYMNDSEDPATGTLRDFNIDTRELKHAKNFYDFTMNILAPDAPKYSIPWARQMWVGIMAFAECCTFCSDKRVFDVHNIPKAIEPARLLKRMVLLEYGVCPKCNRHKWDLIKNHGLRNYRQLVSVLGQRSGKSSSAAQYYAYSTHQHLMFPNLAELAPTMFQASTQLTCTMVSLNFAKAMGVMWTPYKKLIENSSWYKDYFSLLDRAKERTGHEMYRNSSQYITFYHKNIKYYPSGPNSTTLRGDTRCITGDELVSTNRGLVAIRNPSIVGTKVPLKGESHPVVRHLKQGIRNVVRIKLSTGYWIDVTPEHEFEVLMSDYTYKLVEAQNLAGTYVQIELGGEFGTGDLSTYRAANHWRSTKSALLTAMHSLKTFTFPQLRKATGSKTSSKLTVKLQEGGDLTRLKRQPDGYIPFQLSDISLEDLLAKYDTGVISKKFQATIPTKDSFDLGYILGCMVADGSYKNNIEFGYGCMDHDRMLRFHNCVKSVFGLDYTIHSYENSYGPYYRINFGTRNIKNFFRYLGLLADSDSNNKTIPWAVLQGSESMVKGYLNGHLISDGTLVNDNFMYSTMSRQLAKHLHTLLGHAGILARQKYGNDSGLYCVYVDPAYTKKFREQVVAPDLIKYKFGKVHEFKAVGARSRLNHSTFYAPYLSVHGMLNHMYYSRKLAKLRAQEPRGVPLVVYPPKLTNLMSTRKNRVFLEVVSVTPLQKPVEVFDITVKSKEHLFKVGPGIITHNCGGGLDELGLFPLPKGNEEEDEQSERANADEAHKSLLNSLLTAQTINTKLLRDGYSSAPSPLLLCVSSPISLRDKVMRLLKESKTEIGSQFILGVNLPTWEMNPGMDRDFPEIVMAYASNPEKAERDFGANPPSVHSRFINPKTIEDGVFVNGQNSHTLTHQFDKPGEIYGKIERNRSFRYPSLVTIDAGAVDNSFTLTGGHYDFDTAKTVITTVLECVPQEGRRINFNMMYLHIILPILKELNAVALLADQWQSIDLLNRAQDDMGNNPLQKPRCRARQYSPRRKDFNTTVAMLQNKNLILPSVTKEEQAFVLGGNVDNYKVDMLNKPVPHLMLQMVTVKDVGETRCPEKGDGFTDDIFRACVLFASKVHDPRIMERLVEAKDWTYGEANLAASAPPVYMSRGGFRRFPGLR